MIGGLEMENGRFQSSKRADPMSPAMRNGPLTNFDPALRFALGPELFLAWEARNVAPSGTKTNNFGEKDHESVGCLCPCDAHNQ